MTAWEMEKARELVRELGINKKTVARIAESGQTAKRIQELEALVRRQEAIKEALEEVCY